MGHTKETAVMPCGAPFCGREFIIRWQPPFIVGIDVVLFPHGRCIGGGAHIAH